MAELFDTSNPQLTASDHKIIAFFYQSSATCTLFID